MRILLAFVLVWASAALIAAEGRNPFDALDRERQERLYYKLDALPPTVQQLIRDPVDVAQFVSSYAKAKDETKKFNLVLILDKKLRAGAIPDADKPAAISFFRSCLAHGNPWIVTEAAFALGNAKAEDALPDITACFKNTSVTAVFHAVLAYQMITGELPVLDEHLQGMIRRFPALKEDGGARNQLADEEMRDYLSRSIY